MQPMTSQEKETAKYQLLNKANYDILLFIRDLRWFMVEVSLYP